MTTPVPALTRGQISRPPLREAEACTLVIFGATGDGADEGNTMKEAPPAPPQ